MSTDPSYQLQDVPPTNSNPKLPLPTRILINSSTISFRRNSNNHQADRGFSKISIYREEQLQKRKDPHSRLEADEPNRLRYQCNNW